ncbi:transcription antitermination factor NusB [Enterococcus canis]|uniref:Transcription antitermination protein NusB n=1 Tax=Enterococcus canis TaxID=214095 RepID=A0A1L8RKK1_9ENTE|nr:transcription antitermination factor NusB [Enterococcus canis]
MDLSKQDAIREALLLDHEELLNEEGDAFVPVYLDTLVGGVCAKQHELDEEITKHLSAKWTLNRLAKMDLVILRMAIFEMRYVDDVPATVALNEALELAKEFSDDQSRRFINGVLSNVMKDSE